MSGAGNGGARAGTDSGGMEIRDAKRGISGLMETNVYAVRGKALVVGGVPARYVAGGV